MAAWIFMDYQVTVEQIQKATCKYFNVTLGNLKSKRRSTDIDFPRQVAMYLCRRHTSLPFSSIGFKFGGREHSTVLHALKIIEKKISQDPRILASIVNLEMSLHAQKASIT